MRMSLYLFLPLSVCLSPQGTIPNMAPLNHIRVGGTFIFLGIKIGSVKAGVHYKTELDPTVVANNGLRTTQIKDGIQSEVVVV